MTTSRARTAAPVVTLLLSALVLALLLAAADAGAAARPLKGGTTTLTLEPSTAQGFMANNYPIYLVAPGQWALTTNSLRLRYPVAGGSWDRVTARGRINHTGGFFIVHVGAGFWQVWRLTGLRLQVGATPRVTAVIGGVRQHIFDADLSGATVTYPRSGTKRFVRVAGVKLTFSASGAASFGSAFGTAPLPGYPWGTMTTKARFK